ncbi:MAG: two-component system sensor histidine kinase NtrB [Lacrimispora saccharolytica]
MPRQTQSYEDNENYLLLSKVSHEIRNPVALINSFLQLLAVNHPELKDDNCFLKIEENMDFLKGLLDELSTYNHSHTANMEDVNPYLLLQDLTASAALCWNHRESNFSSQKETAVPRIPIDKIKFQQLISNLIRNAAESMPDGGTIHIRLSCDGDFVTIKVEDTGCGIPEEYLPTLFDLFVTHKKNGTGLGLAICREIVTAHHGSISAQSVPGEGTTFTVMLPVA